MHAVPVHRPVVPLQSSNTAPAAPIASSDDHFARRIFLLSPLFPYFFMESLGLGSINQLTACSVISSPRFPFLRPPPSLNLPTTLLSYAKGG